MSYICPGALFIWMILIVFSQTPEEHLVRLKAVFKELKAAGLRLKPSKCELFRKQINYLGHVVGHKGVSTGPKNISSHRVA